MSRPMEDEGRDENRHHARAIAGAITGRRSVAGALAGNSAGSARSGDARSARRDQGRAQRAKGAAIAVATMEGTHDPHGTLELRVPQDRGGLFRTDVFSRSEKALLLALAEIYVQGVFHAQRLRRHR